MRTFVDGEAANTQSSSRAIKWADTAIGRSGTGSANPWSGDIAEIMIYDTALSDDDRQAVEQYLKVKWFSEPPLAQFLGNSLYSRHGCGKAQAVWLPGQRWVLCPQRTVSVI